MKIRSFSHHAFVIIVISLSTPLKTMEHQSPKLDYAKATNTTSFTFETQLFSSMNKGLQILTSIARAFGKIPKNTEISVINTNYSKNRITTSDIQKMFDAIIFNEGKLDITGLVEVAQNPLHQPLKIALQEKAALIEQLQQVDHIRIENENLKEEYQKLVTTNKNLYNLKHRLELHRHLLKIKKKSNAETIAQMKEQMSWFHRKNFRLKTALLAKKAYNASLMAAASVLGASAVLAFPFLKRMCLSLATLPWGIGS